MNKTKVVKVGNLSIGGNNSIKIKGMLKAPTNKINLLLAQARGLEAEGAEALRIAVEKEKDLKIAKILKKHISIPIAADIHFSSQLAILAVKGGFDQIRLNPLNITGKKEVKEIAKLAREKKVPIRVGINSGGLKKRLTPAKMAQEMAERCGDYIQILESQDFFDIIVSLKGASLEPTILANEIFAENFNYPLHLGITATGSHLEGITKSAIGLGVILRKGLGDILRVSLTGDSLTEIQVAKYILQALNLRNFGPEIISCPTCSRCKVNLVKLVGGFRKKIDEKKWKKPLKIALMGCVVNGPGEARQADLGVAFGQKKGVFFRKGKVFKKTSEKKVIDDLVKEVDKHEQRSN